MKNCPFCGHKVAGDASKCENCGKSFGGNQNDDGVKLTNIESWQGKSVPAWVMYAIVFFFIALIVLMVMQGLTVEKKKTPAEDSETARLIQCTPRFTCPIY